MLTGPTDTDVLFIVLDLDLQPDECVIKTEVLVVDSDKTISANLSSLKKHACNAVLVVAAQRLFFQYPTFCRCIRTAKQRIDFSLVGFRSAPGFKPNIPRSKIWFVYTDHRIVLDVLDARFDLAFGLWVLDSCRYAFDVVVRQEGIEALRKSRSVAAGTALTD